MRRRGAACVAYSKRFDEALLYASNLHREQVRKGGDTPYVTHLLGVASIVGENAGTEDEVIAALLHDAVEDHPRDGATREEIVERFGGDVAGIVDGCSDTDVEPKPAWKKRKEDYVAHVAGASGSVRLVSASDKLHNARAILAGLRVKGDELWGRFKGGKDGTLWYYRKLVGEFRRAGTNAIVEEFALVVGEIERLARRKEG
jgi:(p)ppGpp synthase/HD superfamily hydrolase